MIISDKYKFCFIHIPKCAGTSVRNVLQLFDDTQGKFTQYVGRHEALGMMDYVHIPLKILREHFSDEYTKIKTFQSFTVLRDPFSRFPSSLSQRLKMYGDKPFKIMSKREIQRSIDEAINYLNNKGDLDILAHDFIHFQKQCTYVFDKGEKLIDNLYTPNDLRFLFGDIEKLINKKLIGSLDFLKQPANSSKIYRSEFLKSCFSFFHPILSKPTNHILPESLKKRIEDYLCVPRDVKMKVMFDSDYIRSFIENYYSEDIKLYYSVYDREAQ